MKLSKEFSRKEVALIVFLALALIGLASYVFAYSPIKTNMRLFNTDALYDEMSIEEAKSIRIQMMKDELENSRDSVPGEIMTYDNIKAEIIELNNIVAPVSSFSYSFEEPYSLDGETVRRNISVSFTTDSLASAENIVQKLNQCKYRLEIGDISITPGVEVRDLESGTVRVDAEMTFFETLNGAASSQGVLFPEENKVQYSEEDSLIQN